AVRSDLVISSALGRGRATYLQSERHPDQPAPDGILLVKNTDDPAWQRKAYVAFDLAALGRRSIAEASLTLTLVPTGLGYAAFVPDATFSVYGVDGDVADDAHGPEWATAP